MKVASTPGGSTRRAPPTRRPEPFDPPSSGGWLRNLIAMPFIYGLVIPIAILDLSVSLYQAVCFRAWRMDQVRRSRYVVLVRHRLPYLTTAQKLNCVYCSYANGVFAYAREIGSVTEQYWCPIKHALRPPAPHDRYDGFVDYGDAENAGEGVRRLRNAVRRPPPGEA